MRYLKFVKVEHTLFSLPIVFSGAFLAKHVYGESVSFSFSLIFWIILAVLGARSFGFAMNRIIDKEIDAKNPRTKNREIPSGQISVSAALVFALISAVLFLFAAAQIDPLCFMLAPIPLGLFILYPFLKRWTLLAHLGLGIAWGTAPLGGWIAVRPQIVSLIELQPILILTLFSIFWVAGFDILYALLDEEFDRENGHYSMPALLGKRDALRMSELFHLVAFLALGTLVQAYFGTPISFLLLASIGVLLILSHWKILVNELTPQVIDFAFFKVNAAVGFLVFLIVLL